MPSKTNPLKKSLLEAASHVYQVFTVDPSRYDQRLKNLENLAFQHQNIEDTLRFFSGIIKNCLEKSVIEGGGNNYVTSADTLTVFNSLMDLPPITFGHEIANARIIEAIRLRKDSPLHLIELGIGSGRQIEKLLVAMASEEIFPPSIYLTAVDLPHQGTDPLASLHQVGEGLSLRAKNLGFSEFHFHPQATGIERADLRKWDSNETLIVNAAFALHHVLPQDVANSPHMSLEMVLQKVAALKPTRFILTEPIAVHDRNRPSRLAQAIVHYGAVLDMLGTLVSDSHLREAMATFFRREIINQLHEGPQRVERHRSGGTWIRWLTAAGFHLIKNPKEPPAQHSEPHPDITITHTERYTKIDWKTIPLVAVLEFGSRETPDASSLLDRTRHLLHHMD